MKTVKTTFKPQTGELELVTHWLNCGKIGFNVLLTAVAM